MTHAQLLEENAELKKLLWELYELTTGPGHLLREQLAIASVTDNSIWARIRAALQGVPDQ